MVSINNCLICNFLIDSGTICGLCEKEIARRALAKEPLERIDVKKVVEAQRQASQEKATQEMLRELDEQEGRNRWRSVERQRDKAWAIIDEVIETIDFFAKTPELREIRGILNTIPSGRMTDKNLKETRQLLEESKKTVRDIIDKHQAENK